MMARMAFSGQVGDEEFERRNRRNKKLTLDEFEYVQANCANCSEVGAEMNASTDLKENGVEMPSTRIVGVTANMVDIEEKRSNQGRFIHRRGHRSAKVCVIGDDVREKFFPNKDPIGQVIRIRGVPLQIVGVEEKNADRCSASHSIGNLYSADAAYADLQSIGRHSGARKGARP